MTWIYKKYHLSRVCGYTLKEFFLFMCNIIFCWIISALTLERNLLVEGKFSEYFVSFVNISC